MHPSVSEALEEALPQTPTTQRDLAAIALARQYARMLDLGQEVERIGPLFLAVLGALGMTPASRAALVKGQPTHGPGGRPEVESELDRIRRQRAQRHGGA